MIRRLLGRPLDWRFGAVTARLDSLAERTAHLDTLVAGLDGFDGRLSELTAAVEEMGATLERRVQPLLRTIVAEESANRRRLHDLRAGATYGEAYSHPDPLVSVTLATLGREATLLDRALPSLLAQTHANLEVLVVGDAAADSVGEAVAALGDPRVRYWNLNQRIAAHPDPRRHWLVGSTMARNEAARHARGLWLLHFDDDDNLRPDAIASLLAVAREQRAEVAYGGFEEHHPDGRRTTGLGFPPRLGAFSWAGSLVHGGLRFFERELVAADLEIPGDMFMLERMLRSGVRFALHAEVVLDYFPSTLWKPSGPSASEPANRATADPPLDPDLKSLSRRPARHIGDLLGPELDRPPQSPSGPPLRSYVVCSTPRSGSGLLCRGLAGTGQLGVPLEYFNSMIRGTLTERWGCEPGLQPYLDALHSRRSSAEELFATKVHWDQLPPLREEAGAGSNDRFIHETPDELLERLFPRPLFIRIIRMDVDRQAVSYWRALNSSTWSVGIDEPADAATDAAEQQTPYSFEGIDRCRRLIEGGEHCWERLIRARGEQALVVTYEQLTEDYVGTIERVADYISPGLQLTVAPPVTRQLSDDHSRDLLERFQAERTARP